MAEQNRVNEDERYQYIGFERYGKKTKPLFKNEDDRKRHIQNLKEQAQSVFRKSVVFSEVVSLSDRIAVTIACLVMIVAPFLVWFNVHTLYGPVSFAGITGINHLSGFWFYVEMMGGNVIPWTVYLLAALAYLSILFGIVTLIFLYLPAKTKEAYAGRLKAILRIQMIPFLIFLAVIVLGLVGQRIPFGTHLGIQGLGHSYNVITLIQFSNIGFWLAIFGFIMNFNKSKEL